MTPKNPGHTYMYLPKKRWKLQRKVSPRWVNYKCCEGPTTERVVREHSAMNLWAQSIPAMDQGEIGVNVNIPSAHKYIHCSQVHTVCSQALSWLCAHKFILRILCAQKFLHMRLCSHELLTGLLCAHLECSVLHMFGCAVHVSSWSYRCSSTSLVYAIIPTLIVSILFEDLLSLNLVIFLMFYYSCENLQ